MAVVTSTETRLDEQEWIRCGRYADGRELFVQYGDAIYHFLWSMSGSEAEAADQTVQTFSRVVGHARSLRRDASLSIRLHQAAYHVFLQAEQRRGARQSLSQSAFNREDPEMPPPEDPSRTVEHPDTAFQSALLQSLRELPHEQRCAVVLRYLSEWAYAEIAQVLGCSRGRVQDLLGRARSHLSRR